MNDPVAFQHEILASSGDYVAVSCDLSIYIVRGYPVSICSLRFSSGCKMVDSATASLHRSSDG